MRLEISGAGYRSAADTLLEANRSLAASYSSLVSAMAGYAAMAGSDSCGQTFAADYDPAATAAMQACADLAEAFGNLARLTAASYANHHHANAASTIGHPAAAPGHPLDTGEPVRAPAASLPSALGGDGWGPDWWDWIVDQVGYLFPDADTDRLRGAAAAWHGQAEAIVLLAGHCDAAAAAYSTQTSPEVPAALAAFDGLAVQVRQVAAVFRDLGDACSSYAAAVDQTREEVLRAGAEFIAWSVGIQAAGTVASFFTVGVAQGPTQAAQAAKLAMFVAKVRTLLAALALRVSLLVGPVTNCTRTATAASRVIRARFLSCVPMTHMHAQGRLAHGWGRLETLEDHFIRHGGLLGIRDADDYAGVAQLFLGYARKHRLPMKIDRRGTIRIYDPVTNTFASFARNGRTKTFYKPDDGITYWHRQEGVLQ